MFHLTFGPAEQDAYDVHGVLHVILSFVIAAYCLGRNALCCIIDSLHLNCCTFQDLTKDMVYRHGFYMMLQVVHSRMDIIKASRKPQCAMAPELPSVLQFSLIDKAGFMRSAGIYFDFFPVTV